MPHADNFAHERHVFFQLRVFQRRIRDRVGYQMNAYRGIDIKRTDEIAVKLLRQKRDKRRGQFRNRD